MIFIKKQKQIFFNDRWHKTGDDVARFLENNYDDLKGQIL